MITDVTQAMIAMVPDGSSCSGLINLSHSNRDFFLADLFDYSFKVDCASLEAPIFTLSTKPDLSIWEWRSKKGDKYMKVVPSAVGRATQHDKDVLIFVMSQLTEALNRGREDTKNRTVRFTVHEFLVRTNRQTSGESYRLLQKAFERLRGTSIITDIQTGGRRVKEGFGIIDKWKIVEKSPTDQRMMAVEVTLSDWLYNAIQAFDVLTIHPDYFRLRKPLARRLYELARKHCGHQAQFSISLTLLQEKAGSRSDLNKFRYAVRAIQADDRLPEYRLSLGGDDVVTFYTRDARRLVQSLAARPPPDSSFQESAIWPVDRHVISGTKACGWWRHFRSRAFVISGISLTDRSLLYKRNLVLSTGVTRARIF